MIADKMRYYSSNTYNLHVYLAEKQVILTWDFVTETLPAPGFEPQPSDPCFLHCRPTFLTGLGLPLLVTSTLGHLVAAAIATISIASIQTQSLYIH